MTVRCASMGTPCRRPQTRPSSIGSWFRHAFSHLSPTFQAFRGFWKWKSSSPRGDQPSGGARTYSAHPSTGTGAWTRCDPATLLTATRRCGPKRIIIRIIIIIHYIIILVLPCLSSLLLLRFFLLLLLCICVCVRTSNRGELEPLLDALSHTARGFPAGSASRATF